MQDIRDNIFRINNPDGYGSGFVFSPENNESLVYLVTSRHNLVDEENGQQWNPDQLTIDYRIADTNKSFALTGEDIIHYGNNNDIEDIGLIIIRKDKFIGGHTWLTPQKLCKLTGGERLGTVSGFPKLTSGKQIRTLYQLTFLSDKDYSNEIQLEVSDPISKEYNTDNLVEGYSGSPIIINSGNQQFIGGIFRAYEKSSKRVLGINLNILNRLLTELGHNPIDHSEVETDTSRLEDIAKLRSNTDRIVKRIRNKIGTIELQRIGPAETLKKIIVDNKIVVVSGKAGSGKSALTKAVLHSLTEEYEVIALQGEQLDRQDISTVFSAEPFLLKNQFSALVSSPALLKKKILLIDSIEKILETSHSGTILDFLDIISAEDDMKLVLTCRTYAIENLKFRFLHEFPSFSPYEIPLLSDKELITIENQYPHLKSMLNKPSLRQILQIPFNIDKAAIIKEIDLSGLNSEADFRRLMWEYIIENANKEPSTYVRQQRGELFSEIAIRRAEKMVTYISVDGVDAGILSQLNADSIIDIEPIGKRSYAASHDIYEDWALTRYIQKIYEDCILNNFNPEAFYTDLGTTASIRRAFRIWMAEKVQEPDFDLSKLVKYTLQENVVHYWKDEILVAILQSDYSERFLEDNKDLLFEDNFKILKRCLLLLKVSCRQPDFDLLNLIKPGERQILYHDINLVPVGVGWANAINFCHRNLSVLTEILPSILPVILNWKKSLSAWDELPPEAKNAGLIILEYFKAENFAEGDKINRLSRNRDQVENAIRLLFRLTPILTQEIKSLILEALNGRETKDYRIRNLYDKVIEFTLSGDESMMVCHYLPDVVLTVAEKEWFYYPPTPEEIKEKYGDMAFLATQSSFKNDKEFGVNEYGRSDYFPAGPFKTPIGNLLYVKPFETLNFTTRLLNHATESYLSTDFALGNMFITPNDVREEISITLHDGTVIKQHCSMTLWTMYRGNYIALPNLLKSVLMAVEDWLLKVLKSHNDESEEAKKTKYQQLLDGACEILLKKSNNVATTSVLVSVALAYRDPLKKWILPLLRIKSFYMWDLYRRVGERNTLNMVGSGKNSQRHFKYLKKFNDLEHRQKTMQDLVINYSLTDLKIFSILDAFYADAGDDTQWKMLLNRMDRRTWKIVEEVEQGFIVQSQFPDDLKAIHSASEEEQQQKAPMLQASNWALKKLHRDPVEDDSYEKWKSSFESSINTNGINLSPLENQPRLVAAIGIRDYFDKLTTEEKEKCMNLVIEVINYELTKEEYSTEDMLNIKYSAFETESAFEVLPRILASTIDKKFSKEAIFLSLLKLDNEFSKDKLIERLNEETWQTDPDFMMNCIKGMLKYSEVAYIRGFLSHQHVAKQKQTFKTIMERCYSKLMKLSSRKKHKKSQANMTKEDLQHIYIETWEEIFHEIVNDDVKLDITLYNFDQRGDFFYAFEVLKVIPPNTLVPELHTYILNLLQFVFNNIDADRGWNGEKIHFELCQRFEMYLAAFMLNQPIEHAQKVFDELTKPTFSGELQNSYSRRKDKFIEQTLEAVIRGVVQNESLKHSFWLLWEHFLNKTINHGSAYYCDKLLLNHMFFNTDSDWEPIKGKKPFFEKVIKYVADIDSTAKLIATIGYSELMPDGIIWLSKLISDEWSEDKNTLYYLEKIAIKTFYDPEYRNLIRTSANFRCNFIVILDQLIDIGFSSTAYVIREDLISTSR